jgi:hypothetical protein
MSLPHFRGDPHYPVIGELFDDVNEWRNVSETVRLTIKGLSDAVKTQGEAICKLEQQLCLKTKELSSSLGSKASVADVKRSMTEVVQAMEHRMTMKDVKILLADKVSKSELLAAAGRPDNSMGVKQALAEIGEELEVVRRELVSNQQQVIDSYATKAQVAEVEAALHSKANKQSVATALHRKANKEEAEDLVSLKTEVESLMNLLESKVSISAYEHLVQEVKLKADVASMERLVALERSSAQRNEYEIAELRAQMPTETSLKLDLETAKAETERVYLTLQGMISRKADEKDLQRLEETLRRMADTEQLAPMLDEIHREIAQVSAMAAEGREIASALAEELAEQFYRLEARVRDMTVDQEHAAKWLKDLGENLHRDLERVEENCSDFSTSKAAEFSEVKRSLDQVNCDISRTVTTALQDQGAFVKETRRDLSVSLEKLEQDLLAEISRKADLKEIREVLQGEGHREQVNFKAHMHSLQTELEKHVAATKEAFEDLYKSTLLKADIKDVCTLLDLKANSDEVCRAFADLTADLSLRALAGDLKAFTQEQLLINEVLCTESCVGRWLWKSRAVTRSCVVPWEVQSVNTCPENFLWERGNTVVVTVTPGLYQVCWGFFSKSPPHLQLIVNGETVFAET